LKHFLCYTPGLNIVEVSPPPYFKNDFITFGTFNNMAKITPEVLSCWVRIMKRVENSRLVLKSKSFCVDRVKKEFLSNFQENGIDPSRIILLNLIHGHQAHLTAYSFIDIQLDVFPYAGTTTSCEGLFMGVPLLTLSGDSHAHNVGVTLLQALEYPELIARSDDEYVSKAIELAHDPERLIEYRRDMRPKMLKSDLCNGKKFTESLEDLYHMMWYKYCYQK
jgi:protein O-GlcNAc transferase